MNNRGAIYRKHKIVITFSLDIEERRKTVFIMKVFTSFIFVSIVLIHAAIGLKCYTCFGDDDTQCSKSFLERNHLDRYLAECLIRIRQVSPENLVSRKKPGTLVMKTCSSQSDCQKAKTQCEMLNGDEKGYDCVVDCCFTDACNVGSPVSANVALSPTLPGFHQHLPADLVL
ncbi:hypothetical protein OS493_009662 [Desmophyllum pertusum]|uniref:Uncharacterized protein n=1 Tax=Desmophyllum pertusum TaxID=174260 RepID=A0A9W9YR80_9CNID|nr:hypothetical protein OS493_009662 [Desmophyllum pertusum]